MPAYKVSVFRPAFAGAIVHTKVVRSFGFAQPGTQVWNSNIDYHSVEYSLLYPHFIC